MDRTSITLRKWGESMHLTPNGKEGNGYTAEEVYEMLPTVKQKGGKAGGIFGAGQGAQENAQTWDDHEKWGTSEEAEELEELWVKRFADACTAVQIREEANGRGLMPAFAKRIWDKLTKPQTDWRTVLNEFVQTDMLDYSFSPPDRRYTDSSFFLPDLCEQDLDARVSDILFMIDTSASITDRMMTVAYSEIRGAVNQFGGKLKGWLGFFDAAVIEPVPFDSLEELEKIQPAGGGGTDFRVIFEYVKRYMMEAPPACIIILTDGYAPFPNEKHALGIPVLWLINNEQVDPPWGKVARIRI